MFSTNPHTAYYSLLALESIVKNCGMYIFSKRREELRILTKILFSHATGIPIHEEISNKVNCEMFVTLVNNTQHENVRAKMLELIQTWAYAFRTTDKYRSIRVSTWSYTLVLEFFLVLRLNSFRMFIV
jgi:hepatocyte growth factor-regulated tyrosine kinase substrate